MKMEFDVILERTDNNMSQNDWKTYAPLLKKLEEMPKVERMQTQQADPPLKVKYKNWQGEIGIRTIFPAKVWYGHTDYHVEDQWLMDVWDIDKDAERTYAMVDIIEFIKE